MVKTAVDSAMRLRAAAAVSGIDPAKAVEFIDQAYKIEQFGPGAPGTTPMSQEEAVAAWSKTVGKDWTDPAVQDEVYKAISELRRKELEKSAKLARSRAAAAAGKPARKPRR